MTTLQAQYAHKVDTTSLAIACRVANDAIVRGVRRPRLDRADCECSQGWYTCMKLSQRILLSGLYVL
jgi:hypothetical protein